MGNNNPSSSPAFKDQILRDHHDLKAMMDKICQTSDLQLLMNQLEELRKELVEHFEKEEAPGGFGAVVAESAPHKSGTVDHLFDEHREFIKQLDRLQTKVAECLAGPVSRTRALANELCDRLRAHEAQEHKLLTDSLYTDLGGG